MFVDVKYLDDLCVTYQLHIFGIFQNERIKGTRVFLYAFAEKTTIKMNFAYNGLWIECHFVENENQPRTFSFSISVVMVTEFYSEVSEIHYKFMEK